MNNLKNKKINPNTEGSTLLLMTLVILSAMLIISLSVAAITTNGLRAGITQVQSTKAYFAAEAGAERILWEIRQNSANRTPIQAMGKCEAVPSYCECDKDDSINGIADICFSDSNGMMEECDRNGCDVGNFSLQILDNSATYNITYFYEDPEVVIRSFGGYNDVNRVIELRY